MLAVILNTASGQGRAREASQEIRELFGSSGVDVEIHEASNPEDIPQLASKAVWAGSDAVIAAGGDGTVSSVAAVVAGKAVLGVLPLGTLNHFAKNVGIPGDVDKAVSTIVARHTRRVDMGRLNDRLFVNNSSIGIYPSIVEIRERLRAEGHRKWAAFARATLQVLRSEEEMSVRLAADGIRIVARTPFLFVGNNEYAVEGFHLGARLRLDGGLLFAYYAPPVRTRQLPALFAEALLGLARRRHALESISARELWVNTISGRDMPAACDGEVCAMKTPLHYEICPGLLEVIVPSVQ